MDDIAARTRLVTATTARDLSDWGRAMVETISGDFEPGELVRVAVQLRHVSLLLLDRAVLAERAAGHTWAEIAAQHHLTEADVIRRYADVYDEWEKNGRVPAIVPTNDARVHYGQEHAGDFEGSAASLDQWRARHTEPWETPSDRSLASII